MGLGSKVEETIHRRAQHATRQAVRLSDALRQRSAHAASGLWSWLHHRPKGFLPAIVPAGRSPLRAIPKSYLSGLGTNAALELKALIALSAKR
jgi:hypothetical protein